VVLAASGSGFDLDDIRRVRPTEQSFHEQTTIPDRIVSYLILPSAFDTTPQLRFSKGVLAIIIVALLTGGYSLTLLLYVACPSPLFRQESVFIPAASASLFSFLAILYCLAASSRFTFSLAPCPIALALSAMSAILYGTLAFLTSRRIHHTKPRSSHRPPQRRTHHRDLSSSSYNDVHYSPGFSPNAHPVGTSAPPTAGLWMEPGYYTNFIANMYPSMRPSTSKKTQPGQQPPALYDPAIGTTYTRLPGGAAAVTDDELVARQMAGLLRRKDSGPNPDASGSTFRLDWEFNEEEGDTEEGAEGAARKVRARTRSVGEGRAGTGPVVKVTRADSVERGRSENRSGGQGVGRAKSREERRREIELENLGA
jgi:hypothetical protein